MNGEAVQDYLKKLYPNITIADFERLTSGFEADIYSFRMPGIKRYDDFILRAYLGDGALAKIEREVSGMRHLSKLAYPVPELLLHEANTSILGQAFVIMEKLHGQSLWPALNTVSQAEEDTYLEDFAALQARLHRLDWQGFGDASTIIDNLLGDLRAEFTKFELKDFFPVADWLDKNRVPIVPALVHLDFHANNVFLHPDKRMTVIDWSQFGLSDYRLDLSWTLLIMGDYGKAGWREKILESYKKASGYAVDNLDYFNVLSYNKFLYSNAIAFGSGADKAGLDPNSYMMSEEHKASIRSVYERMLAITRLSIPQVENLLGKV